MKKFIRIATKPLIAAALISGVPLATPAQPPVKSFTIDAKAVERDWNAPPPGPAELRQGYRDGALAAKLDTLVKRRIDPKASHLYLHPPLKGSGVVDRYRAGFEVGYAIGLQNLS